MFAAHRPPSPSPMPHRLRPAAPVLRAVAALVLSTSFAACTVIPAEAPERSHAEALADLRAMLRDMGTAQAAWHAEHASFATPADLLGREPSTLRPGVLIDSVDVSPARWYVRAEQADTGDRCWVVGSVRAGRASRARISCESETSTPLSSELAQARLD